MLKIFHRSKKICKGFFETCSTVSSASSVLPPYMKMNLNLLQELCHFPSSFNLGNQLRCTLAHLKSQIWYIQMPKSNSGYLHTTPTTIFERLERLNTQQASTKGNAQQHDLQLPQHEELIKQYDTYYPTEPRPDTRTGEPAKEGIVVSIA